LPYFFSAAGGDWNHDAYYYRFGVFWVFVGMGLVAGKGKDISFFDQVGITRDINNDFPCDYS
jgi:hypothetical protein